MLTPLFRVAQDECFLLLSIRARHCSLRDAELSYEGRTFLFHAKPYFLRLFLPADVVDNESGTCEYDAEEGIFTVRVPKKTPGEHFPRLEMLSELLRPQEPNAQRLVEELDTEVGEDDIDCFAQQCLPGDEPSTSSSTLAQFGYGFGWRRHGVLGRLLADIGQELPVDLDDPDGTPIDDRLSRLHAFDTDHFRAQHYLADLHEPDLAQVDAMAFDPFQNGHFELSEQDLNDLKDLPRRKLPNFPRETTEQIARSLIDILFGFLYDFRTTLGEHSVETGWTVSRLCPSLTFLLRWPSTREAVRCVVRHSLVLPLYRNWALALRVCCDVCEVFRIGGMGKAFLRGLILGLQQYSCPCSFFTSLLECFFTFCTQVRWLFCTVCSPCVVYSTGATSSATCSTNCSWTSCAFGSRRCPRELFKNWARSELDKLKKADIAELDLDTIEVETKLALLKPLDSDDDEEETNGRSNE